MCDFSVQYLSKLESLLSSLFLVIVSVHDYQSSYRSKLLKPDKNVPNINHPQIAFELVYRINFYVHDFSLFASH